MESKYIDFSYQMSDAHLHQEGAPLACVEIPSVDPFGRPAGDITFAQAAEIEGFSVPGNVSGYFSDLEICNPHIDTSAILDANTTFADYPGIAYAPDSNGNGEIWSGITAPSPVAQQIAPATQSTAYATQPSYESPDYAGPGYGFAIGSAIPVAVVALGLGLIGLRKLTSRR